MKTLTIQEAISNLAAWLQHAIAGEEIGIRTGNTIVALRPLPASGNGHDQEQLSPREALRRLQQEAKLTPEQADAYLNATRAERMASEHRGAV